MWQITGGNLTLARRADGLDLTVWPRSSTAPTTWPRRRIGIATRSGSAAAEIEATVTGMPARDVALQTPALSFLSVIEAPLSGALRATLTPEGAPSRLEGSLDIDAGRVQPTPAAQPIAFAGARAAFSYDAARRRIDFSELSAKGDVLSFSARGHSYLREIGPDGWPGALLGQLDVSGLQFTAAGMFDAPLAFESGVIDMRFRPDPFTLEIGQMVLMDERERPEGHLRSAGTIRAGPEGWSVALDLTADDIGVSRLVGLWPTPLAPQARRWVTNRIRAGRVEGLTGAFRRTPGARPQIATTFEFSDARVKFLDTMPAAEKAGGTLSIIGDRMSASIETGRLVPAAGGPIDLAGTSVVIPDMSEKPAQARIELVTAASLEAVLQVLTNPPLRLFAETGPPRIGTARARLTTGLRFPLGQPLAPGDLTYEVSGALSGLVSDTLVRDRRLTAASLGVEATPSALIVEGQALLDGVPVTGRWRKGLTPQEAGQSEVRGTVELSPATARAFGIALPPGSLAGTARGDVRLFLRDDAAPRFVLTSDLAGARLALNAIDWSKPASATGTLRVEGRLGDAPALDVFALSAAGLDAAGRIDLDPDGAFRAARFDRVRIGGWLDAPITLTARGAGRPPAIALSGGGRYDMRRSQLGGGGGDGAPHGPVEVALDRLIVSEGIALTEVRGRLDAGTALSGQVTARVNGGTSILAELAGGTVRITSDNAGGAVRDAGLLGNARGGTLDLILRPAGAAGTYDGRLTVSGARVLDAPAFAELLNTLSLVGLLEQLAGDEGIGFDDVEAEFRLTPSEVILYNSSAVGAAMGLSMDGRYDLGAKAMDMQGVISPFYFVNVIGSIFTRKGEGLLGISFTLSGPTSDPRVSANPLSMLTPGMFREIFRSTPPQRTDAE